MVNNTRIKKKLTPVWSFIPQLLIGSIKESLVKIMRIPIYRFGLDDVLLPSMCSQYYAYNL